MGPFYQYQESNGSNYTHNSWYADYSNFVYSPLSWFFRGGFYDHGVLGGQFYFDSYTGGAHGHIGFRLVLTK